MQYLEEEYTPREIETIFALLENIGMEEPTTEEVLALNCAYMIESCLCNSGRRAIWYLERPDPDYLGYAMYVDTMEMLSQEDIVRELINRK